MLHLCITFNHTLKKHDVMKRLLTTILSLSFALVGYACGTPGNSTAPEDNSTTSSVERPHIFVTLAVSSCGTCVSDVHLQFQTVPKYLFYIFYSGNFVYWKIYFTFAKFSNGNYF